MCVPNFLLGPVRLLLIPKCVWKTPREGDYRSENVLRHGCGMDAASVCNHNAALAQRRKHQLPNAGSRGMNPFHFFGAVELLGPQRKADENVGIRQFLCYAIVILQVNHVHGGPAFADFIGEFARRAPQSESVPDANDELGVLRSCTRTDFGMS